MIACCKVLIPLLMIHFTTKSAVSQVYLCPKEVLDKLLADDKFDGKDGRQIAVVDAQGRIAAFTGPKAPNWAGDRQGKTWSAPGNILVGPQVPEAMGKAFDATAGQLAEKLFAALKAGDDPGSD